MPPDTWHDMSKHAKIEMQSAGPCLTKPPTCCGTYHGEGNERRAMEILDLFFSQATRNKQKGNKGRHFYSTGRRCFWPPLPSPLPSPRDSPNLSEISWAKQSHDIVTNVTARQHKTAASAFRRDRRGILLLFSLWPEKTRTQARTATAEGTILFKSSFDRGEAAPVLRATTLPRTPGYLISKPTQTPTKPDRMTRKKKARNKKSPQKRTLRV